jgi:hypothetical protein
MATSNSKSVRLSLTGLASPTGLAPPTGLPQPTGLPRPTGLAPPSELAPIKLAPPSELAPIKLAPPSELAPIKLAPLGIAPLGLASTELAPPSELAPLGVAPPRGLARPIVAHESEQNSRKDFLLRLGISESEIISIVDRLRTSGPRNMHQIITQEEYSMRSIEEKRALVDNITVVSSNIPSYIIFEILTEFNNSLKYMDSLSMNKLFSDIRREQTTDHVIEFTLYRSPISTRLIANVTRLRWNGVELLSGRNIMLYESSGESRQTGLGGNWMPFLGEASGRVVKLEDDYIKAIDNINTNNAPANYSLLTDIIRNIYDYRYYMRFINKAYLVASFLLSLKKDTYMNNPMNNEQIRKYIREYTTQETQNAKMHLMNKTMEDYKRNPENGYNYYMPITTDVIDQIIQQPLPFGGGYKQKYLKYKNKYLSLKNSNI